MSIALANRRSIDKRGSTVWRLVVLMQSPKKETGPFEPVSFYRIVMPEQSATRFATPLAVILPAVKDQQSQPTRILGPAKEER